MTFPTGAIIADVKGGRYHIGRELGEGGQGTAWEALTIPRDEVCVAKRLHDEVVTPEVVRRLDVLVRAQLSTHASGLCAPYVRLAPGYGVGAIQPLARGVPLSDLFAAPTYSLLDALGIAVALSKVVAVLEELGFAHGDLGASNIHVEQVDGFYVVSLLDFDNYAAPGAPSPQFRGQDTYAAPELLAGTGTVGITSDRFALAIVLHELLYRRHPFAAAAQTQMSFEDYTAMLQKASWQDDPAAGGARKTLPGLPVGVLPREVQRLFRAALQVDPMARPSAATWGRALQAALDTLFACDACMGEFVNEPTGYQCPRCGAPASVLELRVAGRVIPLAGMSTTVGRDDIGGDLRVSRRHVQFTREGFAVRVRCLSGNGLAVRVAGNWRELAEGDEITVADGDTIVAAPGIEGQLVQKTA